MQYFGASLLTLLGLANSLQCTEDNGGHNTWSNGPRARLQVHPHIEEWQDSRDQTSKKVINHKKNEPLNMTCMVVNQDGEKKDNTFFDYDVDWKGPRHITNKPKIRTGQSPNMAWIWFEHLAEDDAGNYTCIAVSHNHHQSKLSVVFLLFVEHEPIFCGREWFRCRSKQCIMPRYVCDGHPDCNGGEDEGPEAGCSSNPCLGKILCEKRCIPADWCCDHRNCSGTFELRPWPHEDHEISYVQTAFYTVIGCAMAFMFIVTILVIALCRVQIKRAMNSRCSQQNRNPCPRRTVPLYDLDVYLNRTADTNYPGGVSIMYNINSGVQFMGRPAKPPPYSVVVAESPREGPPPPYASCENLIVRQLNTRLIENADPTFTVDAIPGAVTINQSIADAYTANPPDTDIRNSAQTNIGVYGQHENSVLNVAGPQAANHPCATQPRVAGSRDIFTTWMGTNSSYSRDTVDGAPNPLESSRSSVRPLSNFELEYVETDALLVMNPNYTETSSSKNAAWKPYKRQPLVKGRWSNNVRNDKIPEKHWYRQTIEKPIEECSSRSREVSTSRDSENEGVFLDTDRQDLTSIESTSSGESDVAAGFPPLANIIDLSEETSNGDKTSVASCSKIGKVDGTFGLVTHDRRSTKSGDSNEKIPKNEMKSFRKEKCQSDVILHRASPSPLDKSFLRDVKRQSSLTSDKIRPQNISESSTSVSAVNVEGSNSRVVEGAGNSQIGQVSNLVLPLRESFIGVQRDS